jgi:small subunit ribosomal protein S3
LEKHKLIREYLSERIIGTVKIVFEQTENKLTAIVSTTEAQLFIAENKGNLDKIIKEISGIVKDNKIQIKLHLNEIKNVYDNAQSVANLLAKEISGRAPFRSTCKRMIEKAMGEEEIKGIKIKISGRLDGNEIARTQLFKKGKISTSGIFKKIDYGRTVAKTKYGQIGITILLRKRFLESNPSLGSHYSIRRKKPMQKNFNNRYSNNSNFKS